MSIQTIKNKNTLDIKNIKNLNYVLQDIWAEAFWEFAQCDNCWYIMDKEEFFEKKVSMLKQEIIHDILKLIWIEEKSLKCTKCNWHAHAFFWKNYFNKIKYKQNKTLQYNLSLLRDENSNIVWFCEWYKDTYENIYFDEFDIRYKNYWIIWFKNKIIQTIWYLPNEVYLFSWIWILKSHKNFFNFYELMKDFALNYLNQLENEYAILEVDEWKVMEKVAILFWWKKIDFDRNLITNTKDWYKSTIYIVPQFWKRFKKIFSWDWKNFIRLNGCKKW